MLFEDRSEAGKKLAGVLKKYANHPQAIVIALPRGGVVVGFEVASSLHLPLDIVCPRKIGAPFNEEFAIGAISETGEGVISEDVVSAYGISENYISQTIEKEKQVARKRLESYRKGMPKRQLKGKIVILVDDGLATGSTMRAAIRTVKAEQAQEILMAIPVAPPDTLSKISKEVDQIYCLATPHSFHAVGQFYKIFDQTTDEEVIALLDKQFTSLKH